MILLILYYVLTGFFQFKVDGSLLVVIHDGSLSSESLLADKSNLLTDSVLRSLATSFKLTFCKMDITKHLTRRMDWSTPCDEADFTSSYLSFGKCDKISSSSLINSETVLHIHSSPCSNTEEGVHSIPFYVAMESRQHQCLIPEVKHWIVSGADKKTLNVLNKNQTIRNYYDSYLACLGSSNKEKLLSALSEDTTSAVSLPYQLRLEQARRFLNGKNLIVVTLNRPPFINLAVKDNLVVHASGFCITMLDTLADKFNFSYGLVLPYDGNWGNAMPNGTFNGMIGMVNRKEVDFAVAGITITQDRQSVIDFTHAFYEEPTTILIPAPTEKNNILAFLDPYTWGVWTSIAIAVVGVSPLMWVMGSYFTFLPLFYPFQGTTKRDSIYKCFWDCSFSLAGQSTLMRQTNSSRFLMGVWLMATISLVSTYTSILTAFLTVPVMDNSINSLEALANQKKILWTYRKGTAHDRLFSDATPPGTYYKIGQLIRERPNLMVNNDAEGIKDVLSRRKAFIKEKSFLDFAMEQDYITSKECRLSQVPQMFFSAGFGWALQEKSVYLPLFNYEILRMAQSGLFTTWKEKFWPKPNKCTAGGGNIPAGPRSLTVRNLIGHFLILGIGLLLGAISIIAEKYILNFHRG